MLVSNGGWKGGGGIGDLEGGGLIGKLAMVHWQCIQKSIPRTQQKITTIPLRRGGDKSQEQKLMIIAIFQWNSIGLHAMRSTVFCPAYLPLDV